MACAGSIILSIAAVFLALAPFINATGGPQIYPYLDIYPEANQIALKYKSVSLYFGQMLSLSAWW